MGKSNIRAIISFLSTLVIVTSAVCYFPNEIYGTSKKNIIQTEISTSNASLTVDGNLNDKIWQSLRILSLKPSEPGVPEELGGNVRIILRGDYLCIGAFCPEPGGKVLAKSLGFNPVWEKNASSSPETEDRLLYKIKFHTIGSKESELRLEVNPWGAFRIERDGKVVPKSEILTAVDITKKGWNVEIAVPLKELNLYKLNNRIKIDIEQIRSRRPLAPEFHWKLSDSDKTTEFIIPEMSKIKSRIPAPVFSPPLIGNKEPALRVGYVQLVPPIDTKWDDPFWKNIPGFQLPRNEPYARNPNYPTEIKWVHDGKTLAVFFRCTEDERVDCDTGARDGSIGGDDHICIYISTTGSSLIEILVNPAGAVRDSKGIGPRMYNVSSSAWNGNIQKHCLLVNDAWYVRVNLPLDEIAKSLGELSIPQNWKVLIGRVRQSRIGEPREISTIPVIENPYFLAPARYRRLNLTRIDPSKIEIPETEYKRPHMSGLAGELSRLNSNVLSRIQRKYNDVRRMLQNNIRKRVTMLAKEEHKEWDNVKTLEDWKRFRDKRIKVLKTSLGEFPKTRSPLLYQESGTYKGSGYRVKNIVYQSRPGFFVAANLFLPVNPTKNMPGIIIIPSHHYPKTQGELKDCGIIWARTDCAVLILETLGHGERVETTPWYRQAYQSEYLIEMQLNLIDQSRYGWIAWDIIRAVDLFYEMDNIDRDRITLIGSVTWGGGPPAAVAGIFDERIDCVIPFNYGRVYWQGWGIRKGLSNKITPWFIYNGSAPRKFIYAHEFGWEGDEGPSYPSLSVPAWPRFKRVYSLYGVEENLATIQGYGMIRAGRASHCSNIGAVHREAMFPILKKWLDIPFPSEMDKNTSMDRGGRMPDSELLSLTPELSSKLNRKPMHKIALEMGKDLLNSARNERANLNASSSRNDLMKNLSDVLIDIEPNKSPEVELLWSKKLSGISIEALTLKTEPGIIVPMFILKPDIAGNNVFPLVITLSEGGKDRFLKDRTKDIEKLLQNGIAVCLPDIRGTGETASDQYNRSGGLASTELELGKTLIGLRLKDVRSILTYIKTRNDIDPEQIALWGDSFAPANHEDLWVDELYRQPVSPQIQHFASPLGAHLALLTALYHNEIKTIAIRGGLVGYLSILDDNFTYVPPDIIIPEILKVGDISDICAHLSPRPLFIEGLVNGRNYIVEDKELQLQMEMVKKAYQKSGYYKNLIIKKDTEGPELVSWLISQLKN